MHFIVVDIGGGSVFGSTRRGGPPSGEGINTPWAFSRASRSFTSFTVSALLGGGLVGAASFDPYSPYSTGVATVTSEALASSVVKRLWSGEPLSTLLICFRSSL